MKSKGTGNQWAAGLLAGLSFFSTGLIAQDQPPSDPSLPLSEDLLPQPVTEGHFEPVLKNSPFLRTLNLSETYALRGVAEIDGVPVATLYNRHSKKTIYVTPEEANEQGMKLVSVVPAQDLTSVMAKIAFGDEEVELKFESSRIAPQPKGGGRSGGGDSGGERKGPSKEDIDRYKALSDEKKEKLKNFIRGTMQKYPDMSREDRGNLIRGAMQKLSDGRDIEIPSGPQPSSGSDRGGGGDRGSGGGDRR